MTSQNVLFKQGNVLEVNGDFLLIAATTEQDLVCLVLNCFSHKSDRPIYSVCLQTQAVSWAQQCGKLISRATDLKLSQLKQSSFMSLWNQTFSGSAKRKLSLLVYFLPRTMCPRWNKGHRWWYATSRLFKLGLSLWTPFRCGQSCVSIWIHQYCCTPLSN